MKLLLLLSDEAQLAHRRDSELKTVQAETNEAREQVTVLLDKLLRRPAACGSVVDEPEVVVNDTQSIDMKE